MERGLERRGRRRERGERERARKEREGKRMITSENDTQKTPQVPQKENTYQAMGIALLCIKYPPDTKIRTLRTGARACPTTLVGLRSAMIITKAVEQRWSNHVLSKKYQ